MNDCFLRDRVDATQSRMKLWDINDVVQKKKD